VGVCPYEENASLVIEKRLEELGISLPPASNPAGAYTNVVQVGSLVFVAGKGPTTTHPRGKLGAEFTTEQGIQFAREAGLEVLAILQAHFGTLDAIKRVVKIQGYVNATPEFDEHHKVLNGCSELMIEVFGENGAHVRSVLGASSLRDNLPLVVDTIFEARAHYAESE
jgi:enamine deaminase RidA (YjgF/YER057c/UK114 family)